MKKKLYTLLTLLILLVNYTYAQNWVNVHVEGQGNSNPGMDSAYKNTVETIGKDANGNIFMSGSFRDFINLGNSYLTGTTITAGGGSDGEYEVYVAKLDPNGNFLWANQLLGGNDLIYDMAVTPDGGVIIAGTFGWPFQDDDNFTDFGGGIILEANNYDGYYAKYDADGNIEWVNQIGGDGADFIYALDVDASGNIYFSGYFNGEVSLGSVTLTASSNADEFFLAKASADGTVEWAISEPSNLRCAGDEITLDEDGNIYVKAYTEGNCTIGGTPITKIGALDYLIIKYNNDGDFEWVRQFYSTSESVCWMTDIEVGADGDLYVVGAFSQNLSIENVGTLFTIGNNLYTGVVIKLDTDGNLLWSNVGFSDSEQAIFRTLYKSPDGDMYVGGHFGGKMNFGTASNSFVPSPNLWSACIFKLNDDLQSSDWGMQIGGGVSSQLIFDMIIEDTSTLTIGGSTFGSGQFGTFTYDAGGTFIGDEDLYIAIARPELTSTKEVLLSQSSALAYPNPFSTSTTIKFENPNHNLMSFTLMNTEGKILQQIDGITEQEVEVTNEGLSPGTYYYALHNSKGQMFSGKLILQGVD